MYKRCRTQTITRDAHKGPQDIMGVARHVVHHDKHDMLGLHKFRHKGIPNGFPCRIA